MEAKKIHLLAPGHTARVWQRTDLNPSSMALETLLLTTLRLALLKKKRMEDPSNILSYALCFSQPSSNVLRGHSL